MKKLFAGIIALTMTLSMAACTGGNTNSTEIGTTQGGNNSDFKVGLIADGAGFGTQSFNDVALEGAERAAKDFGIEIVKLEIPEVADLANGARTLAAQDVDLIVGISANNTESFAEVSVEYPDTKFLLLDSALEGYDNVASSYYRDQEAAFLLGAVGAKLTQTQKIAYLGGISSEIQDRAQYGYMAGAKTIDPEVEVTVSYTGSFGDVGKGKEIATMMYDSGVDYIAPYAGACNLGVFQAAQEKGQFVFGAANGQFDKMPDKIVASQVKRIDNVLYSTIEQMLKDNFEGGTAKEYGLAEGGVALMYSSEEAVQTVISQEIKDEIAELEKQIIDGTIKVPYNEASYKEAGF